MLRSLMMRDSLVAHSRMRALLANDEQPRSQTICESTAREGLSRAPRPLHTHTHTTHTQLEVLCCQRHIRLRWHIRHIRRLLVAGGGGEGRDRAHHPYAVTYAYAVAYGTPLAGDVTGGGRWR